MRKRAVAYRRRGSYSLGHVTLKPAFISIVAALAITILVAPIAVEAQTPKVHRVALVLTTSPVAEMAGRDPIHPFVRVFLQELRGLGYVEGQNLVFERRSAEGDPDRFPAIMAELVRLNMDVIVTVSDLMTREAKQATSTIPIVMAGTQDPVGTGLVASLARPGGNVTGLTSQVDFNLQGKRLEVLKDAVPRISRIAVIHQTPRITPRFPAAYEQMLAAAQLLRLTLLPIVVDRPEQFVEVVTTIGRERADALIEWGSPFNFAHRNRVVELAAKSRLLAVYSSGEYVKGGGLMSYGVDILDVSRRAVSFVGKILKGAKPADLPVEQPTKFELIINMKTAKALGVTIPPSLLLRADQVIE